MRLLASVIVGLLSMGQVAVAQDITGPLTLDDCIEIAIENNISLSQAELNLQIRQQDVTRARSGFLPSASLSSGYGRSGGEQIVANQPFATDQKSSSLRLQSSLNLFSGGYDYYNMKSSNETVKAAEQNRDFQEKGLVFEVQQKYFELLKTQKILTVRQEDLALAEKQLELSEALNEVGSAAKSDVLRAQATVAQKKLNLLTAQNNVNLAQADLSQALAIDLNLDYDVVDIESSQPPSTDSFQLNQLEEEAYDKRLDLRASEANLASSQAAVKRTRSQYLPRVDLSGRYAWSNNTRIADDLDEDWRNMFSGVKNWSYGVDLSFNIFDGFAREANYNQARLSARSAKKDIAQKKQDISLEVKRAMLNLETATERIRQAQESLTAADEDLRLAEERYRLGVATIVDLNTAQFNYTTARQAEVEAIYDYEVARANLKYVVGR